MGSYNEWMNALSIIWLQAKNLALRHQFCVYLRSIKRPKVQPAVSRPFRVVPTSGKVARHRVRPQELSSDGRPALSQELTSEEGVNVINVIDTPSLTRVFSLVLLSIFFVLSLPRKQERPGFFGAYSNERSS